MTNPAPIAHFIHGTNVDESVFERNVRSALDRCSPEFYPRNRTIVIIGGGPSLQGIDWDDQETHGCAVWVLNNAWRDLKIFFDAVVLMDARPETAKFAQNNFGYEDGPEWLVASQCHPDVFDILDARNCNVTIWHAAGPKIIEQLGLHGIRGGGTVLSRAINLAWERGFRDFTLAGVDSSITAEAHHAYPQAINDNDKRIEVETPKGARFITTPELAEQATTVFRQMREYEKIGGSFRIIADGLLPTLWAEFKADFPNGEPTNV